MEIPKAREKKRSYENFEARCPVCGYWNIFNRASDIRSFRLIIGQKVVCENEQCKKEFGIGGDLINPAWQMLIFDCEMLRQQKRYSYCILNLCQAFEMYFTLYLRMELLYKPFDTEDTHDMKHFNELGRLLFATMDDWTYFSLRNVFMHMIIQNINCRTLSQSEAVIRGLHSLTRKEPGDDTLKNIADEKLSNVLLALKKCTVSSLRNDVVHKYGYRPTLEEVEKVEEETSRLLYRIESCLGTLAHKSYRYETVL